MKSTYRPRERFPSWVSQRQNTQHCWLGWSQISLTHIGSTCCPRCDWQEPAPSVKRSAHFRSVCTFPLRPVLMDASEHGGRRTLLLWDFRELHDMQHISWATSTTEPSNNTRLMLLEPNLWGQEKTTFKFYHRISITKKTPDGSSVIERLVLRHSPALRV